MFFTFLTRCRFVISFNTCPEIYKPIFESVFVSPQNVKEIGDFRLGQFSSSLSASQTSRVSKNPDYSRLFFFFLLISMMCIYLWITNFLTNFLTIFLMNFVYEFFGKFCDEFFFDDFFDNMFLGIFCDSFIF